MIDERAIERLHKMVVRRHTAAMTDEESIDVGLRLAWMACADALLRTGYTVEQVKVLTLGQMKVLCETSIEIEHTNDSSQTEALTARLNAFIPANLQS